MNMPVFTNDQTHNKTLVQKMNILISPYNKKVQLDAYMKFVATEQVDPLTVKVKKNWKRISNMILSPR